MSSGASDRHLAKVVRLCLALPETSRSGAQHTKFSVRDRTFAYHLVDHHGDGRVAVWCKVPADENRLLVEAHPRRFFIPPYLGPKGWIGLDLEAEGIDWDEVRSLVTESYRLVAPKRLTALVDS
jgi:hypothetical protein